MEDVEQDTKLLWIAKTERAYLQVLADEACRQLAIRDDVINTQENRLQQKHSDATRWLPVGELPRDWRHDLVPASAFISSTAADVVGQCLSLAPAAVAGPRRCLTLTAASAAWDPAAASTVADEDGVGGGGVSAASASPEIDPTAQLAGSDGCCTKPTDGPVTSEILMTSEGHLPRDAESTRPLNSTEAPADQLARLTASAGTQTAAADPTQVAQAAADPLSDQLAQLTAERDDQRQLLHTQTNLLAQLHSQLTRSAAENERLQRHLQLVNALFEQLHYKEAGSAAERTEQPCPDVTDDTDAAAAEDGGGDGVVADGQLVERVDTAHGRRLAEDGGGDGVVADGELVERVDTAHGVVADGQLVERVDTAHGRRLVIHVSRTYLRLRDLILEKRSLLSEIDKLRGFNQQLERRLSKQERRLSSVAVELHSTWGLVTKLKIQHAQLHTAESVLRYELREKRKILSRLRGELEGSRQRSALASQLNAESELEWRALRRELDQRKRESLVRQPRVPQEPQGGGQAAGETQTGDGATQPRQRHVAVLERTSTDDSQPDGELAEQDGAGLEALDTSVAESDSTESESAGRRTPESQPTDSVDSASLADAAESTSRRRLRLVSLEDQCQQLYTRLVSTTARQVALSARLAELHAQHGASGDAETTPDTSVASSGDTAYASLAETPPTPTEAEQLPSDLPAPAAAAAAVAAVLVEDAPLPLAAVAAVSAVTAEPPPSLVVAAVAAVSAVTAEPPSSLVVAAQRVAVQTDGGPHVLPPLPASQLATETAHRAGADQAVVSAVVAVTEAPIGAAQPTETAAAVGAAEDESDTDEPDNSLDDANEVEADEGAAGATAACEDDVSRSTTDLLEKVGQFLSRTRRGSASTQPPPPPATEPPWSDSEADEAAEAARLGGTSAGCKLISLLPDRMVHLRREREQLTEHIARLQAQNEHIEQKLARMRTERREQRLQGREDSTAKEHLERRVQQLERQLRLQLAERYAVAPQEQQLPSSPQSALQQDSDAPTNTAAPATESQLYEDSTTGLNSAAELPDSFTVLNSSSELTDSSTQQIPTSELHDNFPALNPASELPDSPDNFLALNPASELPASPDNFPALNPASELPASPDNFPALNSASELPASPDNFPALNPTSELPASPDNFPALNLASELPASPDNFPALNPTSELPASPDNFPALNPASELPASPTELSPASELPGSSSRLSASSVLPPVISSAEIDSSTEYLEDSKPSQDISSHQDDATPPEPTDRPSADGICLDHSPEDIETTPREDGVFHQTTSDAVSLNCDSLEARCGDDDATVELDDTTVTQGGATVSSRDTPDQASDNSSVTPASKPMHQAEQHAPSVKTADYQASETEPRPAEEEVTRASPRTPERPLARLHQQLADARGQLRSVQADCRRARHTLQQMRSTAQQEESSARAVSSNQRIMASPPTEVAVHSQTYGSCRCDTPRVSYIEFRRRLTERLSSRPTTHCSSRQRPGSLFKRTAAKCHMCQGSLRPLFARRITCRACGQLFCRRCACLAIHLTDTGEMRVCVHCFYELSASVPLPHTTANIAVTSQPIDSGQAAVTGNCSAI